MCWPACSVFNYLLVVYVHLTGLRRMDAFFQASHLLNISGRTGGVFSVGCFSNRCQGCPFTSALERSLASANSGTDCCRRILAAVTVITMPSTTKRCHVCTGSAVEKMMMQMSAALHAEGWQRSSWSDNDQHEPLWCWTAGPTCSNCKA